MSSVVPQWLSDMSIGGAIAFGVLVVGAVTVVAKAWRPVRKFFHLVDDLNGEPARPGVPARPGLMERMESVEDGIASIGPKVNTIHHEVMPNGGESLRDEVTRNTEGIRAAHDRIDDLSDRLNHHIDSTQE